MRPRTATLSVLALCGFHSVCGQAQVTVSVSGGSFNFPFYSFSPSLSSVTSGVTYTFLASGISNQHPFTIDDYGSGALTGTGGSFTFTIPSAATGSITYRCDRHNFLNNQLPIMPGGPTPAPTPTPTAAPIFASPPPPPFPPGAAPTAAPTFAGCMCPESHPFCWPQDSWCYASATSNNWHPDTCAGSCTDHYSPTDVPPSPPSPPPIAGCMCPESHPFCWDVDSWCYASATSNNWHPDTCAGTCTDHFAAISPPPTTAAPTTAPSAAPTTAPTTAPTGPPAPLFILPEMASPAARGLPGGDVFTVRLNLSEHTYHGRAGLVQRMRTYNGFDSGPVIRVRPGDHLRVVLTNGLRATGGEDLPFPMHGLKHVTKSNLHTHGLHISGEADADNIFSKVEPGASLVYNYKITSDHTPGTHWFHPHLHGASLIQAGGGANGVLIVDDPPGTLPDAVAALDELTLMMMHLDMPGITSAARDYESLCARLDGATQAKCAEGVWSHGATAGVQTEGVLINGVDQPRIDLVANRWYRWRLVYVSDGPYIVPELPGCEVALLAKDGVYVRSAPRPIARGLMATGQRADWVVRCPTGTHRFESVGTNATTGWLWQQLLAVVVAADSHHPYATTTCDLPVFNVSRPCYLVDLVDQVPDQVVPFGMVGGGFNHTLYGGPTSSFVNLTVGTVVEYVIENAHVHSFHQHINHFQIAFDPPDTLGGYYRKGDWHDILFSPTFGTGAARIRFVTDRYVGRQLMHCHFYSHGDFGQIAIAVIRGAEGTTWPRAAAVDPTCHTATARAPTVSREGTCAACTTPNVTACAVSEAQRQNGQACRCRMVWTQGCFNPTGMELVCRDGQAEASSGSGNW